MSFEDVDYYRRRAREERAIAASAENRDAAKAHRELAGHYEALVAYAHLLPQDRAAPANRDEEPV